jgi:sugar phosphate isomerase/epimerase
MDNYSKDSAARDGSGGGGAGKGYADRIFIATFSSGAVETAKKYGFGIELNDLCISHNLDPEQREFVIGRMKSEIENSGSAGRRVIMHGPFTELTPDSIDPLALKLTRDRYDQAIGFCDMFGIKDFVVHSGYFPLIYHREWHVKKSVQFWRSLADSLPRDFTVYVENVFEDDPEELLEVVAGTDRPNVKACLDVGHANVLTKEGCEVTDWIDTLAPVTGHFHLHNNDGTADQHRPVNDGKLYMKRVLDEICAKCAPDVTFTIESGTCSESAEYLKQYFSEKQGLL